MKSTHDETELSLVVVEREFVADGVMLLQLRHADGVALPRWSPGAHIDVILTPELTRQYSLCGDPADESTWQIAVLREPDGRGGSQFVHDKIALGDTVEVRGPRNHFELESAPRYLFIAGGIGVTPIKTMAARAEAEGAEWTLTYGGRSRASMAFLDELTAHFGDRVTIHPQDEKGLIDLDSLLGTARADTLVYCCGPAPLLDAVNEGCEHWASGSLHIERFSAKTLTEPDFTGVFEVELATTGKTIEVQPDETILDAVTAAGVQVLSSCREGTCGTCETVVLDGEVEHRDALLSEDEQASNETMMICVSRARCPRLVLEL
ncbi:PDR/VanB family oxidoreductase [Rhodococcus opacus]|uniref:PDR/VanB family oxidoreductase n=1 Tax=Rhodococcus opacus TaxID=37919 RepID=A0AAX3YPM2_RHOOP|nr:PDR/VanB family oxidoreductase [Rhodococcus opacus]MCZ4587594.1 PDR/VanB family oxidoreductase [Rhodococcus opacus]WLF51407.1 PDR/VanB family oxidoreductase [Rhodococcus opacus]